MCVQLNQWMTLPKVIIEVNKSYKDVLTEKKREQIDSKSELNFGTSESGSTYIEQLEHVTKTVSKILGHIGLKTEGNVTAVRRLGKKLNPANNAHRRCRPLLITTSNSYFLQNCFARNNYLKTYTCCDN